MKHREADEKLRLLKEYCEKSLEEPAAFVGSGEFLVDEAKMKEKTRQNKIKIWKHRAAVVWSETWGFFLIVGIPLGIAALAEILHLVGMKRGPAMGSALAGAFLAPAAWHIWDSWWKEAGPRIKREWNP